MAKDGSILFSIITPSTGRRPKALQKAVESVNHAARFAGLAPEQTEILVGFDGNRGTVPDSTYPVRTFNLPRDNDWGNTVRNTLVRVAVGEKLIFLDDDNVLKPWAISSYLKHYDAEMVIGRIDTQLALKTPVLPAADSGCTIRQGNIHPLCLCVSRRLVHRCGGWQFRDNPEADYLNIAQWHSRAHSVTFIEETVGVYDAGRSLDAGAWSRRQLDLLDSLAESRGVSLDSPSRPYSAAFLG